MPAPSTRAIRRMVTASKPSSSAISSAVSAIRSREYAGLRSPGAGRDQIGLCSSPLDIRTPYH